MVIILQILTLIILTFKLFTSEHEFKEAYDDYKEPTAEEYKAIISPAALRVYKKDNN